MLKYKLYQDNRSNSQFPGKWYARAAINETIGIDGLAAHMASHNSPFSKGTQVSDLDFKPFEHTL